MRTIAEATAEIGALRIENAKLRCKLTEMAQDCVPCGGTGMVTEHINRRGKLKELVLPCVDCADIRELL